MLVNSFWNASDFWINEIPLNFIDEFECKWLVQDVTGWWELPPPEIPADSRPYSDDGDYYVSGRYGARMVQVEGRIIPPDPTDTAAVTAARDRLNASLNTVRKVGVFRVNEPGYHKQARVQISAKPNVTINTNRNQVEFTIQFKASDPRKYSAEVHNVASLLPSANEDVGRQYPRDFYYDYGEVGTNGEIHAVNHGDYHTYGVIRITGPVTNPTITHVEQNRSIKIGDSSSSTSTPSFALPSGQFVDIDLRARTVLLNGTEYKRALLTTDSQWFNLQPGQNTLRFNGNQQTPAVEGKEAATNQALNPTFTVTNANTVYRQNLLPRPTPSSTGQYSATMVPANTASITTGGPSGGPVYINRYTFSSAGIPNWLLNNIVEVDSGKNYMFSVYVRSSQGGVNVRPYIELRRSGEESEYFYGDVVNLSTNQWSRLNVGSLIPMEYSGFTVRVGFEGVGWDATSGSTVDVCGGLFEEATQVNTYFDGSTSGSGGVSYNWQGTAYSSISREFSPSLDVASPASAGLIPVNSIQYRVNNYPSGIGKAGSHALALKPNTTVDNTNTFVIPSDAGSTVSGTVTASPQAQGLIGGRSYTAMVDVLMDKPQEGVYNTVERVNLASVSTPWSDGAGSFLNFWSSVGHIDGAQLQYGTSNTDEDNYARVTVSNPSTQIVGSGVRYQQNKEYLPESSQLAVSMLIRSNRSFTYQPVVRFYSGNSLVRESYGDPVINEVNGWTQMGVFANSPSSFTRMEMTVTVLEAPGESATWNVDDFIDFTSVLIEEGVEEFGSFFDGFSINDDTYTHSFLGNYGRSASKRVEKVGGVDSLSPYARSLVFRPMLDNGVNLVNEVDEFGIVYAQAPNSAGVHTLRINFTVPEGYLQRHHVALFNGSSNPDDTIYFDNFLIVEGDYEGKYFDGSSADASWAGSAHLSESIQSAVTEVPNAEALIQYRSAWIH